MTKKGRRLTADTRPVIENVATESLAAFETISRAAAANLRPVADDPDAAFASVDDETRAAAARNLNRIQQWSHSADAALVSEPAIARVQVEDAEGKSTTYYVCRGSKVSSPGVPLASYLSPIGRLAARRVGDNLGKIKVVAHAELKPHQHNGAWDSVNSIVQGITYGPLTIASFRTLLAREDLGADDPLHKLEAEESERQNIAIGIKRAVRTKMGLRDQAILDSIQDDIFRLPIDSQLFVQGPPGTGKTTTLIKRLAQKVRVEFLSEDEVEVVGGMAAAERHRSSWVMFTPTELLQQYVKEEFSRQEVPADALHVRTWADYRRDISRRVLGILRAGSSSGFILKDGAWLSDVAVSDSAGWYQEFTLWQEAQFVEELKSAAEELATSRNAEVAVLGKRLLGLVAQDKARDLRALISNLRNLAEAVASRLQSLKDRASAKIDKALNEQLKGNKDFPSELAEFLQTLASPRDIDREYDEDLELDEEEEENAPQSSIAGALAAYRRALRVDARTHARSRSLPAGGRTAAIMGWLGKRGLEIDERREVGREMLLASLLRKFHRPIHKYLSGIPRRYRKYRRLGPNRQKWYTSVPHVADIHPLEVDVLMLCVLRAGREFLGQPNIRKDLGAPGFELLRDIKDMQRNQVLVDEATDFSPVQLGCMAAIASDTTRSIVAAGDFNQRLTTWGVRKAEALGWAIPGLQIKAIDVSYRQSRQLRDLSEKLLEATGDEHVPPKLPPDVDSEAVKPVLGESLGRIEGMAEWLAQRIMEVDRAVGSLRPSMAIFVPNEGDVEPLARAINDHLGHANIQAVACLRGQALGQDNDVRIFDIQHVKGLEFEAVFFAGVDHLAAQTPELFERYLYVGSTRAATYLGLACSGQLPSKIKSIRPLCDASWGPEPIG